jgi:hypothetical protein
MGNGFLPSSFIPPFSNFHQSMMSKNTKAILKRIQEALQEVRERYKDLPHTHPISIDLKKLESKMESLREEALEEEVTVALREALESNFSGICKDLNLLTSSSNKTLEEVLVGARCMHHTIDKLVQFKGKEK